ncbi:hypothetical protein FE810_12075 [Thalassotalea litorea]|uniref:2OG-Fe(II) oxygenase n=1 Tax=Thalassotalea litorea TaxID=2020715 RepID=A0A5R9IGC1_9GAMM|nr:DUF6445 family protein [Thalassotalea litorea]TLU64332.1 hypothetical protein FE810_12075 [Thalassotalea litorea]
MSMHLNPGMQQQAFRVGHEQTPIFVIDDFMLDTAAPILEAAGMQYRDRNHQQSFYPGVRAPVSKDYGMTVLTHAAKVLYQVFGVPRDLRMNPKNGSYSLLTQPENRLQLLQCIPHYDNTSCFSFAIIHYLNPGQFGGTGFYRHKPSGFENINDNRKPRYLETAQQHLDQCGGPEQKYITDSTDHFELIKHVDYRPNRLVIYPSTLLHSAYIENPEHDVNADPTTGRLTANFFVEFTPTK